MKFQACAYNRTPVWFRVKVLETDTAKIQEHIHNRTNFETKYEHGI